MMDLSDGLALDLSRLCAESAVGARVRLAAVPVAPELRELATVLPLDPLQAALSGGEDYELVAAGPRDAVEEAGRRIGERFAVAVTEIGEIVEGQAIVAVDAAGHEWPLEPKGWDHFGAR